MVAEKESKPFKIARGTKQGDPVSCTLFDAVLEVVVRRLKDKWARQRWGVDMSYGSTRW